jgi:hypothetical protein
MQQHRAPELLLCEATTEPLAGIPALGHQRVSSVHARTETPRSYVSHFMFYASRHQSVKKRIMNLARKRQPLPQHALSLRADLLHRSHARQVRCRNHKLKPPQPQFFERKPDQHSRCLRRNSLAGARRPHPHPHVRKLMRLIDLRQPDAPQQRPRSRLRNRKAISHPRFPVPACLRHKRSRFSHRVGRRTPRHPRAQLRDRFPRG